MEAKRLFLATLDDLQARLDDPEDEYKMLRAAGPIRQLILDKQRLMDVVNKRDYGIKVWFRITKHPLRTQPLPAGSIWYILDGVDPERFPEYPVETLDRSRFLRVPTMRLTSGEVTIKDIIKHAANAEGGVHLGASRSPRAAAASGLLRVNIDCNERSAAAVAMKGIISVALTAMEPLRAAVTRAK